jgi:hypothetical protein
VEAAVAVSDCGRRGLNPDPGGMAWPVAAVASEVGGDSRGGTWKGWRGPDLDHASSPRWAIFGLDGPRSACHRVLVRNVDGVEVLCPSCSPPLQSPTCCDLAAGLAVVVYVSFGSSQDAGVVALEVEHAVGSSVSDVVVVVVRLFGSVGGEEWTAGTLNSSMSQQLRLPKRVLEGFFVYNILAMVPRYGVVMILDKCPALWRQRR